MRPNGAVIYDGPSLLDGQPIFALATGLVRGSANEKTGPMVQVWYMPKEIDPYAALHSGLDFSVCGDCPARGKLAPKAGGGQSCKGRFCYVNLAKAPVEVWRALHRGSYDPNTDTGLVALRNRVVRLGAWGDPASVPTEVSRGVVDGASKWTAYTAQWRKCDPALKTVAMASVHTPEAREEAKDAGWRTFRLALPTDKVQRGEIRCPASKEAGQKTICYACGLCSGLDGKGKADIIINVHGLTARHGYAKWRKSA